MNEVSSSLAGLFLISDMNACVYAGLEYSHFTNEVFVIYVRFEVFTAVTMKNGVFLDVTPCGSCKNQRFGGTWHLNYQDEKNR
jgi:hypothetical protein